MTWSEIPTNPSSRTLRQFAGACLIFFPAIGLHQFLMRGHHTVGVVLMILGAAIGLAGLIWPALVRWIFVGWMIAAFPIGWIISQVMLAIMFFGLITPVAVFFKLRGRDLLQRKRAPGQASYWAPKETPGDVRRYFCQY